MLTTSRKIQIQDYSALDFTWSFKPIIIWMRVLLGINWNPSTCQSTAGRNCRRLRTCFPFGLLILGGTIAVNIVHHNLVCSSTYYISAHKGSLKKNESFYAMNNLTEANLLIIRIDAANEMVYNCVVVLLFYAAAFLDDWAPLWSTLQLLHQFHLPKLDREFYLFCRKITYIGMLCILMVSNL